MSWRISRAENLPPTCKSPGLSTASSSITPPRPSNCFRPISSNINLILIPILRSPSQNWELQTCPDPPQTQRGSRPPGPTPTPRPRARTKPQTSGRRAPARSHHHSNLARMANRKHPRRRWNDYEHRHGLLGRHRQLEAVRIDGLSLGGSLPIKRTREWFIH